jgi:hypothetical protein
VGIVALLAAGASSAWADLRTFDVGLQHQQEIFSALRNVLNDHPELQSPGIQTYGRVQLLPNGQILVNAEPEALVQLEQVIRAIRERPVAAAPRVTLRYWAVLGSRAEPNAANGIGLPPPPVLNDVLTELRRLNGELTYRVIGTATVVTESGQFGEVEGMTLSVKQTAYAQGNDLSASIEMVLRGRTPLPADDAFHVGTLKVQTSIQGGEFLVLGESAAQGGGLNGSVFYIVHWAATE